MLISRRIVIAGAVAAAAPLAQAQTLDDLKKHPGYRAWTRPPKKNVKAPLDTLIDTGSQRIKLGEWMDGRPAVVTLWATWCGPCLAEKQNQADMSARLEKAGARTRILALQAFDNVSLADSRILLKRLGAETLANAQASRETEKAFIAIFGKSPVDPTRTSMPSLLLVGADGAQLGLAVGMMPAVDGRSDYWADNATFEFLSRL